MAIPSFPATILAAVITTSPKTSLAAMSMLELPQVLLLQLQVAHGSHSFFLRRLRRSLEDARQRHRTHLARTEQNDRRAWSEALETPLLDEPSEALTVVLPQALEALSLLHLTARQREGPDPTLLGFVVELLALLRHQVRVPLPLQLLVQVPRLLPQFTRLIWVDGLTLLVEWPAAFACIPSFLLRPLRPFRIFLHPFLFLIKQELPVHGPTSFGLIQGPDRDKENRHMCAS